MPVKLTKRSCDAARPKEDAYDLRDTEISGLLLRVLPTGSKAFYFVYRLPNGGKKPARLGDYPAMSPEGARRSAKDVAGQVARGIDPNAVKQVERAAAQMKSQSTLRAFLDKRYETHAGSKMKTADVQLERIRSDFADDLDKPMASLGPEWAEKLRLKWLTGDKKVGRKAKKPQTINRDFQRVRAVLRLATTGDKPVLKAHPLAEFKKLDVDKGNQRKRFLSVAEEAALRAALNAREDRMRQGRLDYNAHLAARDREPLDEYPDRYVDYLSPMVLLGLNCGLRRGEIFALRWSDIHLHDRKLTVQGVNAKTKQTRDVPLNTEALDVLTVLAQRRENKTGLVFPSPSTGDAFNNINKSWGGVVKDAKLENFHFHDLRHHFASRLVQSGANLVVVKDLLGHSDIKTTMRYAHADPASLIDAVEKIAR